MSQKVLLLPSPGHIARNCPNPSWVDSALTAHEKVRQGASAAETPQKEEPAAAQDLLPPENKCNCCKGQPKCTCSAITRHPARDPHTTCPEDLTPVHHKPKDL